MLNVECQIHGLPKTRWLRGECGGVNPADLCKSVALQSCQTVGNSQKLIIGESGIDAAEAPAGVGGSALGVDAGFQLQLEGGFSVNSLAHENISFLKNNFNFYRETPMDKNDYKIIQQISA